MESVKVSTANRIKDLEAEIQSLKLHNRNLELMLAENKKSCKNNSISIILLAASIIFLAMSL